MLHMKSVFRTDPKHRLRFRLIIGPRMRRSTYPLLKRTTLTHRLYLRNLAMGQFNYAESTEKVAFWVRHWGTIFATVAVRGPFPDTQIETLRSVHGIDAHIGADDAGHFSPMQSLAATLEQFSDNSSIEGVRKRLWSQIRGYFEVSSCEYCQCRCKIVQAPRIGESTG